MVSVKGCKPCGVDAVVAMFKVVLLSVVIVVTNEIPATELVLFSVIVLPLAIFSVVTVKITEPAVPVLSVPTCAESVTVLGIVMK